MNDVDTKPSSGCGQNQSTINSKQNMNRPAVFSLSCQTCQSKTKIQKSNGLQEYSARQEQVRILMPKIMLHKLLRAKVILDEVTTMEN